MATFSENQVRHLYVVSGLKSPSVAATDTAGSIAVKCDNAKKNLYFSYKGADTLLRSDLIPVGNILSAVVTDADRMAYKVKTQLLTLDPNVNSGAPVAAQDYVLRIIFKQYIGISEENIQPKYGMVHATTGMTASDFYKKMAISLAKNFCKEVDPLLVFKLKTATGTSAEITALTKEADLSDTYTGIVISEADQRWILGIMQQTKVQYYLMPTQVTYSGDNVCWGVVTDLPADHTIPNGKNIADLEYFLMGERGDVYRNVGFPYVIPTHYLVDATIPYNLIDIHYFYSGENESVQKSEKTITLAVPKVGATNSVSNVLTNSIISAINTATGLSINSLGIETS